MCRLAPLLPQESLESNTWGKSVTMACLLNVFATHPCKSPVHLHLKHPKHLTEARSQQNSNTKDLFLDLAGEDGASPTWISCD